MRVELLSLLSDHFFPAFCSSLTQYACIAYLGCLNSFLFLLKILHNVKQARSNVTLCNRLCDINLCINMMLMMLSLNETSPPTDRRPQKLLVINAREINKIIAYYRLALFSTHTPSVQQ